MTKVEELNAYLEKHKLRIGGIHPGQEATAETIAEEILSCLQRLEVGDFEIVSEILSDASWEEFDD